MNDVAQIEPLFPSEVIAARLEALAADIAGSMSKDFAAIAILKGSFVFAADLIRALAAHAVNPEVDFMTLASYGTQTISSGEVRLLRDVEIAVQGREVLLIDDDASLLEMLTDLSGIPLRGDRSDSTPFLTYVPWMSRDRKWIRALIGAISITWSVLTFRPVTAFFSIVGVSAPS